LALVKAIVENHGGSISASNRKDGQRGAEFTLKLPIYSK
jgi:nitrogen fixation/metabolism regulation signal transduction histidine kinase